MRILFYLPVVTPWWFSNIIVPMIRAAACSHEVHVIVPPFWHGTGIGKGEAPHIETFPHVHWHLLNGSGHPILRTDASDQSDLIDFVCTLNPDLILCRSADIKTPALFPGTVRYIMESAAPPAASRAHHFILTTSLFDYGFMPSFEPEIEEQLDAVADELWPDIIERLNLPSRGSFLKDARLEDHADGKKKLIGLPLEYENDENFFWRHHAFPSNAEMITAVADAIGKEAVLLVTHHPLTALHGDTSTANSAIIQQGGRVKLLNQSANPNLFGGNATQAMIKHCDAVVLGNSKSWSFAAVFETPMARLSTAKSADWLGAYDAVELLLSDLHSNTAKSANPALTKRWFAHHILNCLVDPLDEEFCAQDIVGRAFDLADPARWSRALARYRALQPRRPFASNPAEREILHKEKSHA